MEFDWEQGVATDKNVHPTSDLTTQFHRTLRLCQELTQMVRDLVSLRELHLFGIHGPAHVRQIECAAVLCDSDQRLKTCR